jgi:hypothetical protein
MILGELIEALKDMFFSFLYMCFMFICKLIDFIKDIFYMLCGIDTVEVNGEQSDLLSSLIQSDTIKRTFLNHLHHWRNPACRIHDNRNHQSQLPRETELA